MSELVYLFILDWFCNQYILDQVCFDYCRNQYILDWFWNWYNISGTRQYMSRQCSLDGPFYMLMGHRLD